MTHKTIAQRYVVNHELGKGGMGTVYLGQDTRSQTSVAIKQLKPDLTSTELIERFKREGEALRELNHPNIVKMLDAIEEDGQHYLIMEYVSGGDLSNLLAAGQLAIERHDRLIRERFKDGQGLSDLARDFGISPQRVYQIVSTLPCEDNEDNVDQGEMSAY